MNTRIYYFSGTGNSLHTARSIASQLGGAEIISVRSDAQSVPADDAEVIGFVCPVYEWDIPGTMKSGTSPVKNLVISRYFRLRARAR